jgi:cytidylate kinase
MLSDVRVAISGKSGCGNTTVSRLVAEKLGLRMINYTFKTMAAEMGISFEELRELAEKDGKYDRELDLKQVQLAREPGCVLGSRLAIWVLEDADLKVYLDGPPEIRAARIAAREGKTVQEALRKTTERDQQDRDRYLKLYNINVDDFGFVDLHVDTSLGDQHYVAGRIVEELRSRFGD